MKKNQKLVFIAVYVALSIALDMIKEMIPFLNMPNGGSINIATIPVVFCSFHLGTAEGLAAGGLWWLITSIMGLNKWYLNIVQYVVDYVLPSVVLGLAAIFYRRKNLVEVEGGIIFMMIIRTLVLVISGVYFWPDEVAAGSSAAWAASLAYNLPYSIATMVMLMIVIPVLLKALSRYLDRE